MIEWIITPRGRPNKENYTKLEDGTFRLNEISMLFRKDTILQIIKSFGKGKGLLIGFENGIMYLKDSPEGYKIIKAGNHFVVNLGYKVIQNLRDNGIELGTYRLEEVEDYIFKCVYME